MRLYTFTNMYLSSIQQGIQPLHVLGDMFVKYSPTWDEAGNNINPTSNEVLYDMLHDWAENHKTVICLNGGFSENLHNLISDFLSDNENPYPWASFREGQDSLESALTSVGIVLPEHLYQAASAVRSFRLHKDDEAIVNWRDHHMMVFYGDNEGEQWEEYYSDWEVEFVAELNKYSLAK